MAEVNTAAPHLLAEIAARANAASAEVTAAVPQFEVAAGATRNLTRANDQGADIVLAGAGATIAFSASAQGNGFVFSVINQSGGDWTVPAFAGATREYPLAAAHTKVLAGGEALFRTYTRDGTMYVRISGDTA